MLRKEKVALGFVIFFLVVSIIGTIFSSICFNGFNEMMEEAGSTENETAEEALGQAIGAGLGGILLLVLLIAAGGVAAILSIIGICILSVLRRSAVQKVRRTGWIMTAIDALLIVTNVALFVILII